MRSSILDLGGYLQVGSDRQIQETLEPVEFGELRRTINGTLKNITDPSFRKYRIDISCNDLRMPAFDTLWKGSIITIHCISEFTHFARKPMFATLYTTFTTSSGTSADGYKLTLSRIPVAGSVVAQTVDGTQIEILDIQDKDVYISDFSEDVYLRYRPVLECMVESWSSNEDEAQASNNWQLTALEI